MATRKKPAASTASKKVSASGSTRKRADESAAKPADEPQSAKRTKGAKVTASKAKTAREATAKTAASKTKTQQGKPSETAGSSAKKPKGKGAKPKPVKSPFGAKFIQSQKEVLLAERAKYVASAQTWKAEADSLLEGREPGDVQFDEESGEGDSLAIERERDLALSSHARAAVEEIDAALLRIERGTYGVCITSGKAIPKERLEVIPWAAERVEYKAAGLGRR